MFSYLLNPWISGSIMILILVYVQGKKYYGGESCKITKDMTCKVVVITGANRGVGFEIARELAKMGASIVFACRNYEKTLPIIRNLKKETENERIEFMQLDLADMNSIKRFAIMFKPKYKQLDVLINNAGVYMNDYMQTREGNEVTFAINLLGPFLLTNMLLDLLMMTPFSRVINVADKNHFDINFSNCKVDEMIDNMSERQHFSQQYAKTKLGMVMFSKVLQARVQKKCKIISVNPGTVDTELFWEILSDNPFSFVLRCFYPFVQFFLKEPFQGAQTALHCAIEDYDKLVPGGYYSDCQISDINPLASNQKLTNVIYDSLINTCQLT